MLNNLIGGSGCIVNNSGMIKKMYFPREIIVLAQVLSAFIIMILGYIVIMVTIVISGHSFTVSALMLPVFFTLLLLFVLGYTLFFSAITVYVRDVQYFLTSISMAFFFMTPMYFTLDNVSGLLSKIVWFNPFTYYVEALHQIIYYGNLPSLNITILCAALPVVSLLIGAYTFHRLKSGFAERL